MPDEELPSVTVAEPPVSLVREATLREGGVVVTFRLETTADDSRAVEVRQELPAGLDIADAGFSREAAPDEWSMAERTVVFETPVPAAGRELVFGVSLDDGAVLEELPTPTLAVVERSSEGDGLQGADPATLEEAVRRVEAGEAPTPDLSERLSAGIESDDGEETVELTREELAQRNEQLMWLRAKATVAERRRAELREAVVALRDALAAVDGVEADSLPGDDLLEDGPPVDTADGTGDAEAAGDDPNRGDDREPMHEDTASLTSPSED